MSATRISAQIICSRAMNFCVGKHRTIGTLFHHSIQTTPLSSCGSYQIAIINANANTNTSTNHRTYFTNTDQMKKSDPYAALGLTWGATATEIKDAYRKLARELHPDVSQLDPVEALNQFRIVKDAYDKLMNNKNGGMHRTDIWEEWSFAIWRNSDIIAQERTDVAGVAKKRPVKPAESIKRKWGVASLGHPDGRGANASCGEYLASGTEKRRSSTVGTGQNKWVTKKEFRPWNPQENNGGVVGLKKKGGSSSQYRNATGNNHVVEKKQACDLKDNAD